MPWFFIYFFSNPPASRGEKLKTGATSQTIFDWFMKPEGISTGLCNLLFNKRWNYRSLTSEKKYLNVYWVKIYPGDNTIVEI